MTTDRPTVHWSQLTMDSPREDVLAAVAEHERRVRDFVPPVFPEVPEGFVGCVMSIDGTAIGCYGPVTESPSLVAQASAGEEDQSIPGWDSLP